MIKMILSFFFSFLDGLDATPADVSLYDSSCQYAVGTPADLIFQLGSWDAIPELMVLPSVLVEYTIPEFSITFDNTGIITLIMMLVSSYYD